VQKQTLNLNTKKLLIPGRQHDNVLNGITDFKNSSFNKSEDTLRVYDGEEKFVRLIRKHVFL
jgi:hypothetical protein